MASQGAGNKKAIGGYSIIREIGRGGMGVVYEAYQGRLKRPVAVKVISSKYSNDAEFVKRFEREARITASIEHANVVRVFDFGHEGSSCYLVMELVDGMSLSSLLSRERALDLDRSLHLLIEMAEGLRATHKKGVLHRDIKPHNIMVDRNGNVKVMDFGLAKPDETSTQMTNTGAMLGTPAYMAPEQGRLQQVSIQSDIYSLGVVFFEMLTGRTPFDAENPLALLLQIVEKPFPAPTSIVPSLPESVDTLVGNMVAKDPSNRYKSIDALMQDAKSLQSDMKAQLTSSKTFSDLVAPLDDSIDGRELAFALDDSLIDDIVTSPGSSFAPPVVSAGLRVSPAVLRVLLGVLALAVILALPFWLPQLNPALPNPLPEYKLSVNASEVMGEVGKRYVYDVDNEHRSNMEWIEEFERDGETYRTARIKYWAVEGIFLYWEYLKRGDAVYIFFKAGDEYPVSVFETPLVAGKTWEAMIRNQDGDEYISDVTKYYFECDEVTVTVPAGTFQAIRVVSSISNPPNEYDHLARVFWFVPGRGMVKLQYPHPYIFSLIREEDI